MNPPLSTLLREEGMGAGVGKWSFSRFALLVLLPFTLLVYYKDVTGTWEVSDQAWGFLKFLDGAFITWAGAKGATANLAAALQRGTPRGADPKTYWKENVGA